MKNILFFMLIGAFIAALVHNHQYEKENNRLQNEIYKLKAYKAYNSVYFDGLAAESFYEPIYGTWWFED